FAVTAKQRGPGRDYSQILPHSLLLLAYVLAIPIAFTFYGTRDTLELNVVWACYNTLLLGSMIWLASGYRGRALARLLRAVPRPRWYGLGRPRSQFLRLSAAVALALCLSIGGPAFSPSLAARFVPGAERSPPRAGVYLPVELGQNHQPGLERELGLSFQIVGRSQSIADNFDTTWARRLREAGARPWMTLLFETPDKPTYYASLPAIANGLYDDALRRWARDIRDFGSPVYVTILQHVDRNWVASSAVANGGIPQDVPRAWQRARSIFQDEGATNVAWVWAPGGPVKDDEDAPTTAYSHETRFTTMLG